MWHLVQICPDRAEHFLGCELRRSSSSFNLAALWGHGRGPLLGTFLSDSRFPLIHHFGLLMSHPFCLYVQGLPQPCI